MAKGTRIPTRTSDPRWTSRCRSDSRPADAIPNLPVNSSNGRAHPYIFLSSYLIPTCDRRSCQRAESFCAKPKRGTPMRSLSRLLCLGLVCAAFTAAGVWAETPSPKRKMPRLPAPGMGAIVESSPSPTLQAMQEELTPLLQCAPRAAGPALLPQLRNHGDGGDQGWSLLRRADLQQRIAPPPARH